MSQIERFDSGQASAPGGLLPAETSPERIFARRMKRERIRRGWRQEDLAERLAAASLELHPSTITKMEREPDPDKGTDPRMIRLNEAVVVARVFERSVDQMLADDDLVGPAEELQRLQRELAYEQDRLDTARDAAATAQHRVAEIHMRIDALQESILAQRREFLEVSDERQAYFQRRLAEAQFRTDAIVRTISQHQSILQTRKRSDDKQIQEIEATLRNDGPEAFASKVRQFLTLPAVPDDRRPPCRVAYASDRRTLLVECELPSREVIPNATAYRYVRANDALVDEPRPDDDVRRLYSDLISRIALRVLAEAFDITRPDVVETIVLDACISATDRATGGHVRPVLISVSTLRESFAEVNLDEPELEPAACLGRHLGALVSPRPYELEPVQPLLDFDLSLPRVPAWLDEDRGLHHRPDLLDLDPVQFESLVRTLFERLGVNSWVTQSVDDGVDAVAAMNDPIVGGLCVLQVKRYSRALPLDVVRSLAGIMQAKRAAKGILITTSWVGKAGHDFAERNGAIEIIDGRRLRILLKEHLGLDARIGLKKLPLGWEREDILPDKAHP